MAGVVTIVCKRSRARAVQTSHQTKTPQGLACKKSPEAVTQFHPIKTILTQYSPGIRHEPQGILATRPRDQPRSKNPAPTPT
jgi:hypothetical protein